MNSKAEIAAVPEAAVLTPRGRGAIASIRLRHGDDALDRAEPPLFVAANGRRLAQQSIGRVLFGVWGRSSAEEVIVCRRDPQTVEIHCHGGDAAVARILSDLHSIGCRTVTWQEQSTAERGLFATECLEALAHATTLRTADILLDQCSGTLRAAIEQLRADDFGVRSSDACSEEASHAGSEEAKSPSFRTPNSKLRTPSTLESLLAWSDFGLHLTRPWRVVVTGRPNVGKSSLVNALLGYARSIVYDQPGTTRDVVTAETAFQGWPIQLADTAGVRATTSAVESAGIAKARAHLAAADCRIVVFDSSQPADPHDFELLAEWPDALVVAHKSDLPDDAGSPARASALRVSSLTGTGIDVLAAAIVATLVPRVPAPGTAMPVSQRQVDLLREVPVAAARGDRAAAQRILRELLA